MERGAGRVPVQRLPYVREQAMAVLADFRHLVLVGAPPPVAYFAYPGLDAALAPPGCALVTLATPDEDCAWALDALAEALSAKTIGCALQPSIPSIAPNGPLSPASLAAAIAASLTENAIVIDEGMTAGRSIMSACEGALPHDWLGNTGGSIGSALPLAVGAAIACPDRRVLCISADGCGMFAPQALWTMARYTLDITIVLLANRSYAILEHEYQRIIGGASGPAARNLFGIDQPEIDWSALSKAIGIPATRVETAEALSAALAGRLADPGPSLTEVRL
jgi:acetolactate synthase-1/2/3 large subunit